MLFVSLLQGFGLLPGRSAGQQHAPAVEASTGLGAVAEIPSAPETSKPGITPKASGPRSGAKAEKVAVHATSSPAATRQRRDTVKKAANQTTTTVKKAVSPAKAATPAKAVTTSVASKSEPIAKAKAKPAEVPEKAGKPAAKAAVKAPPAKVDKPAAKSKTVVAKPTPVSAKPEPAKAAPLAKSAALVKPAAKTVVASKPVPAAKKVAEAVKSAVAKPVVSASAVQVKQPVVQVGKSAAAAALQPQAVAAPVAPTRRGGRKSSQVAQPTPQPLPSHSPDAAKATFSHISERVMTFPVHSPVRKDPKLANNWKTKTIDVLSDEEVLAMPDAEYMNDVQMAFFRLKLVRLKDGILANAGETTEHLREDTVVVPDPADRATIEEEHALELRTRDRERKLLKKIEQSIARIDSGDYGYCDETGEAIGVGRLIARPTASLSLEAQQRRELKQKMFGD